MGGKTATSTSQTTIPSEVLARYNSINTMAQDAASKPYQSFGTQASDFVAQMNQQQNAGISGVNAAAGSYKPYLDSATGATQAGMGSSIDNIQKYMSPYLTNVADTTSALMRQSNEQAQSGALGAAASSGAFGGDRAGIAAANLAGQNQLAMGKTMADIYNQGYGQAASLSQADLARQLQGGAQMAGLGAQAQGLGLQGAQAQLSSGTMQQQTEQAGKDAMIQDFMQKQGYPFQTAQFLANIALGTGVASGTTTTAERPVGFFQRLATGGRANGYADGGGVAGPMQYGQSGVGSQGYVPAGVLPVGDLMISQIPQDEQKSGLEDVMKIASMFMGGKAHGGAAVGRHGYADGGSPVREEPGLVNSLTRMARDSGQFISDLLPENPRPQEAPIGPNLPVEPGLAGSLARAGSTVGRFVAGSSDTAPTVGSGVGGGGADRMPVTSQGLSAAPRYKEYVVGDDVFRRTPQGAIIDGYGNPVDINRAEAVRNAIEAQDMLSGAGRLVQSNEMVGQFRQSKEDLAQRNAQRNRDALAGMYQGDFPVSGRASGLAAAQTSLGGPGTFTPAGMPAAPLSGLGGPGTFPAAGMPAGMPEAGLAPTTSLRPPMRPDGLGAASVATQPAAEPQPIGFTGVAGAGKGYTDVVRPDGTVERREGARNWRNNNPGNIEFGPFAEANGAIGSDGRFAVFPTYEAGRAAKEALLFSSNGYAGKTIAGAIERYAPRSDNNNTDAYIATVAGALGVDPNTPLAELNPAQRSAMLTAMERVEGGGAGNDGQFSSYSTTTIPAGGDGVSGLAGGADQTQTQPGGLGGPRKDYEDRNALGKFFYTPEGKLNKNSVLSVLQGLGAMVKSPSMSPIVGLLEGVGAGASAYSDLELKAAEIAQAEAATRETDVRTSTARFFMPPGGGTPLVIMPDGTPVDYWTFQSSPELKAQLGSAQVASIEAAAKEAGAVTPPSEETVYSTPEVQASVSGEINALSARGGDRSASAAILDEINQNASAAGGSQIAQRNTQLVAFSNLNAASPESGPGFQAPWRFAAANAINFALKMAGSDEQVSGTVDDAQLIGKAQALLSSELANSLDQTTLGGLQAIANAMPNASQDPQASAELLATLVEAQQRQIDLKSFSDGYINLPNNQARTAFNVQTAFNEAYGGEYEQEKAYLKKLILEGGKQTDPQTGMTLMQLLTSGQLSEAEAHEVLKQVFPSGYPIHITRYFTGR
jgi:hypothetical protein